MMTSKITPIARALGVSAVLVLVAGVPASALQASSGMTLEIESSGSGPAQLIKLALGDDSMRFDTDQMSMVSLGGDDGKMLMIQHAQKMYMEFTAETMMGMAGMMGGRMPAEVEEEIENMTPPTFTRTGNTKQVGEWNAYEVKVDHPDQDGDVTMWFSMDVGADFRDVATQMMDSMSGLLNNPMISRMGGGGGGGGLIDTVKAQLRASEMPDGFPVQIITDAGGSTSTITLRAINPNASFDASTWVPSSARHSPSPTSRHSPRRISLMNSTGLELRNMVSWSSRSSSLNDTLRRSATRPAMRRTSIARNTESQKMTSHNGQEVVVGDADGPRGHRECAQEDHVAHVTRT